MKNYKTLIAELAEAMWPGTPEYKKKFGETPSEHGSRHNIDRSSGVVRATRKYDASSGESDEPTKNRDDAAAAPVKRGRGRPPGKYGSYKKKVKESIEILEALETEEEIEEFIYSLDEESFSELEQFLSEGAEQTDEAMSHQAKTTMKHVKGATPGEKKAAKDIKPGVAGYRDRVAMLKSAEARGGLKEEEQIDELSKSTLGSYAKKASSDAADSTSSHMAYGSAAQRAFLDGDKKNAANWKKSSDLFAKRSEKRRAGVDKAVDRLTKEETEVDEALKHPNHKVLDKNKNNKLDKEDFAILRGEKKAPMKEETTDDSIAMLAAFITKQAKGEA